MKDNTSLVIAELLQVHGGTSHDIFNIWEYDKRLWTLSAQYELPERIVTDSGSQFDSLEFKNFLKEQGVESCAIPPHHSLADSTVQMLKMSRLNQMSEKHTCTASRAIQHNLSNALFIYQVAPHGITRKSLAELFLERLCQTCLSLLKTRTAEDRSKKQLCLRNQDDKKWGPLRSFREGEKVWAKNTGAESDKWSSGQILHCAGLIMCEVLVSAKI